jgi:hypothetical protein
MKPASTIGTSSGKGGKPRWFVSNIIGCGPRPLVNDGSIRAPKSVTGAGPLRDRTASAIRADTRSSGTAGTSSITGSGALRFNKPARKPVDCGAASRIGAANSGSAVAAAAGAVIGGSSA